MELTCVCGKKLVEGQWLCRKCTDERDKRVIFCQLCGKSEADSYIGSPVSHICKECVNIVERFSFAKNNRQKLWRQVNGVDEPIKDEYGLGEMIAEVEVNMAQMKRVLHNLKVSHNYKVEEPESPLILNGDRAENFIRTFFWEHPLHLFNPHVIAEAAHNISIKQATDICNKLVETGFLKSSDRGYRLSQEQIELIRKRLEDDIAYHTITGDGKNDKKG